MGEAQPAQPVECLRYAFRYNERIECLCANANQLAAAMVVAAQFIYFNLHFVVGASLTVTALLSWTAQLLVSTIEWRALHARAYRRLNRALDAHFWLNRLFTLLYMPFLIWAVVLMIQRHFSGG